MALDDSPAAHEVGIHHVRPALWLARPFGEHEVPGAVADTFARGGRNLQRIHGESVESRTMELWEELSSLKGPGSAGTSTACSSSASSGTISRARSWVDARTT